MLGAFYAGPWLFLCTLSLYDLCDLNGSYCHILADNRAAEGQSEDSQCNDQECSSQS